MKSTIVVASVAAALVLLAACGIAVFFLAPLAANIAGIAIAPVSGEVKTESRDVSNITAVEFASVGDLTITQGDTEGLTIRAEDRVLRQIKTEVNNGKLRIWAVPESMNSMNTSRGIYYTLTVKRLDAISHTGAGQIHVSNVKGNQLAVTLSGAGSLEISGEVDQQNVVLSGAGKYDGANLKTRASQVTLTGMGSATVWATDTLDAKITSVGSISYYGSPTVKRQVTGLGSINGLGNK